MFIRQNPFRYHPPHGWNDMTSAPRDGSVIEVQNNWGIAPWFSLCRFNGEKLEGVKGDTSMPGLHLSWRPYRGAVEDYRDPTGGAQETNEYWLQACGIPAVQPKPVSRRQEHKANRETMGGRFTPAPVLNLAPYLETPRRSLWTRIKALFA